MAHAMTLGGTSSFARTVDLGTKGSEIPGEFSPVTDDFSHTRQEVMIAMRDGVKLFTVILIPKTGRGRCWWS